MTHPSSCILHPALARIVIGVLVQRLGGDVTITQDDIDAIAYRRMNETGDETGLHFHILPPPTAN